MNALIRTVRELLAFLWRRRLWWLAPLIAVLLLIAGLIALGAQTGRGPLLYPLF